MPRKTLFLVKIGFLGITGAILVTGLSLSQDKAAANEKEPWNAVLSSDHQHAHASHAETHAKKKAVVKKKKPTLRAQAAAPSESQSYLAVVDQPDIREEHKQMADEVIRMLPLACQKQLKNFYVRYDNPKQRGLAGKNSAIISGNVPKDEFRALLIHEIFGHVLDLGCLRGTSQSGPSGFKDGAETIYRDDPSVAFYAISWSTADVQKRGTKKSDFVTGYAAWDPFEDMAESITYFVLQEEAFRARALTNTSIAQKLNWIETYVFTKNVSIASGQHAWEGDVPWDATKLPYIWNGKQVVKN